MENTQGIEYLDKLRHHLEAETSDSLKLLAAPENNPICATGLDASIPCVEIVWKGYASSSQLRFILEHILSLLKEHRIFKILADDLALPIISDDDRIWIAKNWMPRTIAAGLRAIATRKPASYFGEASVARIHSAAPDELTICAFPSLIEAREWLRAFA